METKVSCDKRIDESNKEVEKIRSEAEQSRSRSGEATDGLRKESAEVKRQNLEKGQRLASVPGRFDHMKTLLSQERQTRAHGQMIWLLT